jgi:hypothetical protein
VLGSIKKFPKKMYSQLVVAVFSMLGIFFGSITTGYSWVTIQITAPFLTTLFVLVASHLENVSLKKPLVYCLASFSVWLYILPIVIGPLNHIDMIYEMYPSSNATVRSQIPLLRGLYINPEEERDLQKLSTFFETHGDDNTQVVCFPYCPLFNVFIEKKGTFFNFFIFEMFRKSDQAAQIAEMEKSKVQYVIIQKPGYIDPEAELENNYYTVLLAYIHARYHAVFETDNFMILER